MNHDEIYALHMYYQDEINDEYKIIELLKRDLLNQNMEIDEINNILINFYKEYGINITNEEISEIAPYTDPIHDRIANLINQSIQSIQANYDVDSDDDSIDDENEDEAENIDDADAEDEDIDTNPRYEILNSIYNNPTITIGTYNYNSDNTISSELYPIGYTIGTYNYNSNNTTFTTFPNNTTFPTLPNNRQNIFNVSNALSLFINNFPSSPLITEDIVCTLDDQDKENLKKITLTEDLNTHCSICLGNLCKDEEIIELKCEHKYHTECILKWLEEYNYKCPNCKQEAGKPKYNI